MENFYSASKLGLLLLKRRIELCSNPLITNIKLINLVNLNKSLLQISILF